MCYFVITRSRDLEVAGPSREQVVDDFDLRGRLARAMAEGSTFMRERSPATFDINGNSFGNRFMLPALAPPIRSIAPRWTERVLRYSSVSS
jgi:hypothetical protein